MYLSVSQRILTFSELISLNPIFAVEGSEFAAVSSKWAMNWIYFTVLGNADLLLHKRLGKVKPHAKNSQHNFCHTQQMVVGNA